MGFLVSLKDPKQGSLVTETSVRVRDNSLVIQSSFEMQFRLPKNNFTSGNYWVDAYGKVLLVELFVLGELVHIFSFYLGPDFDQIFPNAAANWGAYFFKLHYSF